eukprot:4650407-Prymnesium_polylepis.1
MAALPVIDLLRPVAPLFDRAFEPLVVLIAALLGTADAFAQASIFGLASAAFPPLYTKALMFGISICGSAPGRSLSQTPESGPDPDPEPDPADRALSRTLT